MQYTTRRLQQLVPFMHAMALFGPGPQRARWISEAGSMRTKVWAFAPQTWQGIINPRMAKRKRRYGQDTRR